MTDQLTRPTGFSLPLSPSGTSSMLTPPPWRFAGEVVMIDYRVDPDAAARFLPEGLTLGEDPGAAAAVWAFWQWTSADGAELTDPTRCQFGEFLILLRCEYQGKPMARCPYAWVDSPVPMMRGWVQGMPKQFGVVHQTRPMRVGTAGPHPDAPGRYDGVASVYGNRVATGTVHTKERVDTPPLLHDVPLVHTRTFPAWVPGEQTRQQLVASQVTDVEFSEIWAGDADFTLIDSLDADYASLAPVSVDRGYVFSYAETLVGGRSLG